MSRTMTARSSPVRAGLVLRRVADTGSAFSVLEAGLPFEAGPVATPSGAVGRTERDYVVSTTRKRAWPLIIRA
jgi:hypothetical protein